MSAHPGFTRAADLDALRRVGAFDRLTLVGLAPAGAVQDIPSPLVARC